MKIKGTSHYYLASNLANCDVEVTPDIFYRVISSYINIDVEYEENDYYYYGQDTAESEEQFLGHIIFDEGEECNTEENKSLNDSTQK